MSYAEGFVIPVPIERLDDYRRFARLGASVWREHGALAFFEGVADDAPDGKPADFFRAVDLRPGETVAFAFILYSSRAHRDRVMARVAADPRMQTVPADLPYDSGRMIFGGFEELAAFLNAD